MPSELLNQYRKENPEDARSDSELTFLIGRGLTPEALAANPDFASEYSAVSLELRKAHAGSLAEEFVQTAKSGIDTAQAHLYSTAALGADILGLQRARDAAMEGYRRNVAEASENAPTIQSPREIGGFRDTLRYGLGLVGSQAPQFALTAAGAVAGELLGGPPGAVAGASIAGGTQMQNYGELSETPGVDPNAIVPTALAVGTLGAWLEGLVPAAVTKKLFHGASEGVSKLYLGRIAKEIPLEALSEGGTEIAQELVTIAGEAYANRGNPDYQLTREDIYNRLIANGFAGALIGGGVAGPISAIPGPRTPFVPPPSVAEPPLQAAPEPLPQAAPFIPPPPFAPPLVPPGPIMPTPGTRGPAPYIPPGAPPITLPPRQEVILDEAQRAALAAGVPAPLQPELSPEQALFAGTRGPAPYIPPGIPPVTVPRPAPFSPALPPVITQPSTIGEPNVKIGQQQEINGVQLQETQEGGVPTQAASSDNAGKGGQVQTEEALRQRQRELMPLLKASQPGSAERGALLKEFIANGNILSQQAETTQAASSNNVGQGGQVQETQEAPGVLTPPTPIPQPPGPVRTLDINRVDFENTVLAETETKQGATPKIVEPAYFPITSGESTFTKALGERLVDQATTFLPNAEVNPVLRQRGEETVDQSNVAKKSLTRRMTFFENQDENGNLYGKVVGFPTWWTSSQSAKETKENGGTKVYRVGPVPGTTKGTTLVKLMASGNWVPVGSVRLKPEFALEGTKPENVVTFEDYKQFAKEIELPATEQIQRMQGYGETMPSTMESHGQGPSEAAPITSDQQDKMLNEAFVDALYDLGVSDKNPPTLDHIKQAIMRASEVGQDEADALIQRFAGIIRQLKDEPGFESFLDNLTQEQAQQYLLDELANRTYEQIQKAGGNVASASELLTEVPQNAGGNAGAQGSDTPTSDRYSRRSATGRITGGEISKRFARVTESLSAIGVDLKRLQESKEWGKYSGKDRQITLALADAENPSADNLILLLHESAHDIFKSLPQDIRRIITANIDRYLTRLMGEFSTVDPRITDANPSGLPKGELDEEVFAEFLAQSGFQKPAARGIAASLFRYIKDLYFRAAIVLQRALGRVPSANLAFRFAENRFAALEAGGPKPLLNFLIPPQIDQDSAEIEARYSLREERIGDRTVQTVIPETRIASHNEQIAFEHDSVAPALQAAIGGRFEEGTQPSDLMAWFRREFRLPNPVEGKIAAVNSAIDPVTQQPIPVNAAKRIKDFQGADNQNRMRAANNYYMQYAQRSYAAIENALPRIRDEIKEKEAERTQKAQELQQLVTDYTNVDGLTRIATREFRKIIRGLFNDISGESAKLGVVSQELADMENLSPQEVLKQYGSTFKKLFGKDVGTGEKLVEYLDRMSGDPAIDLTKTASQIREDLKQAYAVGDTDYAPLVQDTKESKALLGAVIAFTKTNRKIGFALELRKLKDLNLRAKINTSLQDLLKSGKAITGELEEIGRSASIETRLRDELNSEKRGLRVLQDRIDTLKTKQDAGEAVVDAYRAKMIEAQGINGIHVPAVYGEGFRYWVPSHRVEGGIVPVIRGLGEGLNEHVIHLSENGEQSTTSIAQVRKDLEAMREFLDVRESTGDKDGVYYRVLGDHTELVRGLIESGRKTTDYTLTGLAFSDIGKRMKATGSPHGLLLNQMFGRYVDVLRSIGKEGSRKWVKIARSGAEAAKALGVSPSYYETNLYQTGMDFMDRERDIIEKHPNNPDAQYDEAFKRLRNYLAGQKEKLPIIEKNWAKFAPHYKEHLKTADEMGRWLRDRISEEGLGVRDPKLLVESERGVFVPGERKAQRQGVLTVPRHIGQFFSTVYSELEKANMQGMRVDNIAQNYDTFGAEQVHADMDGYFANPLVRDHFAKAIANEPEQTPFYAPKHEDGVTQPEANPAYVAQAYDTSVKANGGNFSPVTFAEELYRLHDGQTDKGQYVQEVLTTFKEHFDDMTKTQAEFNPDGMKQPRDLETMIPGFMVNARSDLIYPSSWLEYETFTEQRLHRMFQKVAAEIAFGPRQERLRKAFDSLSNEMVGASRKLGEAKELVKKTVPSRDKKTLEAALEKAVGGKEELQRLRRMNDLAPSVEAQKNELVDHFRTKGQEIKSVKVLRELVKILAIGAVENPTSALSQLADVFSPVLNEPSPASVRFALRNIKDVGYLLGESLFKALGLSWIRNDRLWNRLEELGYSDPGSKLGLTRFLEEPTDPLTPVGKAIRAIHQVGDVLSQPINRPGQSAPIAPFRPLAWFRSFNAWIHAALTKNTWQMADEFMAKALPKVKDITEEMNIKQIADTLDINRFDRGAFIRFFSDAANDWGLDFYTMLKEADRNQRAGKDRLSDTTLRRLAAMATKTFITESDISTMPVGALNNSAFKVLSPLLTWSFRRAGKVADLRFDADGKASMAAVAKGLTGLMLATAGGLGVSALVDLYNEDVLRKKRNLRRLTLDQGAGNLAMAVLEHTARIGTFGMFGDLANSAVNVATGAGDNRGISFDGRIVLASSLTTLLRDLSNWANEEKFAPDYATVVRPTIMAAGGNGALQWMQVLNRITGDFFKTEAEAVARTNVNNWLRVIGREIGLEVRRQDSSGGFSTATPITPYLTRMQLAAYGNDMQEFRQAYRDAVAEAKESGKPDPVDYVRRAYESRNPLRSIFQTSVTEAEYRRILGALPEDGRNEVREGINLFNRFGASIGAKPFDGKKPTFHVPKEGDAFASSRADRLERARNYAVGFGR